MHIDELKNETSTMKQSFQKYMKKHGPVTMVIDDDPIEREMIQKMLMDEGITACVAEDIKHAAELLNIVDPAHIVMDICGVPQFEEILNKYGKKVIVFTGLSAMFPEDKKSIAGKFFSKDELTEMITYLKRSIKRSK